MKYEQRKAREICDQLDFFTFLHEKEAYLRKVIKEIIRDVRHKAAENVLDITTPSDVELVHKTVQIAHNRIMNTSMD